MPEFLGAALAILVVGSVVWGMRRSWARRSARDAAIGQHSALPSAPLRWNGRVQYVASTRADAPLERLALPGLDFRGFAEVTVSNAGVSIQVDGASPVSIPTSAIDGVERGSWTIDRGVGQDGLVQLRWRSAGEPATLILSALRLTDGTNHRQLVDALESLSSPSSSSEAK